MPKINSIREMAARNMSYHDISKKTGHDWKTVKKYAEMDDFSPKLDDVVERPSILDPYKETITKWLKEDLNRWYKQRHTARRIYDRLRDEEGYTGSYPTVQRFVKKCRVELDQEDSSYGELVWEGGSSQCDFGDADFYQNGVKVRNKIFILSFPNSNMPFVQVARSENCESVCQCLLNIFIFIGKVPHTIIFDNATGIGKLTPEGFIENEIFTKFRNHYGFTARFCNPDSGNEKGNVEKRVGTIRRNWLVPEIHYTSIEKLNEELLLKSDTESTKIHYKKGLPLGKLFEEDLDCMLPLNPKPFKVMRVVSRRADKYGKVQVDGPHFYSTLPEYAQQTLTIALGAETVEIYDRKNILLVTHRREYGKKRTDSSNPWGTLHYLTRHAKAWSNSQLRLIVSSELRNLMDEQTHKERRRSLQALEKLYLEFEDRDICMQALTEALKSGHTSFDHVAILAARIKDGGLDMPINPGPDLTAYDKLIERKAEDEQGTVS